jgi:hypothetical protein
VDRRGKGSGEKKGKERGNVCGKEKVKTSHTRFSKLKRGDSGGRDN